MESWIWMRKGTKWSKRSLKETQVPEKDPSSQSGIVQVVRRQPLCGELGLAEAKPVSGSQQKSQAPPAAVSLFPQREPLHTFHRGHSTASCVLMKLFLDGHLE